MHTTSPAPAQPGPRTPNRDPRHAAASLHNIPIGEARELPHSALTPAELDSFFGAFFADTVPAELAS